jgi:hypothetical protein
MGIRYLRNMDTNMNFDWYITSLNPEDVFLEVCIENIKRFSKNPIKKVLIPSRLGFTQTTTFGVDVEYVDTSKTGIARREREGKKWVGINGEKVSINEEHRRLIGHGVETFPCCVIDADVWLISNEIDKYVEHTELSGNSCFLNFKDGSRLWGWDRLPKILEKHHRFNESIPFVHVSGHNFLNARRYRTLLNNRDMGIILDLLDKAIVIEGACPEELLHKFEKIETIKPILEKVGIMKQIFKKTN